MPRSPGANGKPNVCSIIATAEMETRGLLPSALFFMK